MKIYSVLYSFSNKEFEGAEVCQTSYTDHDKALAYLQSKISAVKSDFITNVCNCSEEDNKSHIREVYGFNCYSITNTKTNEHARLVITETDAVID